MLTIAFSTAAAGATPQLSDATCLKWKVTPTPTIGSGWNFLKGVSAHSSRNAWAVGFYESSDSRYTFALHWDGVAWTIVPTPNAPPNREVSDHNNLLDVAAVGPNDAWAVGYFRDDHAVYQPLAMRWNGSAWTLVELPPHPSGDTNQYALYSVDGISPNDVWAVGWFRGRALILHWEGTTWRASPIPRVPYGSVLYDVDVRGRNDVWAVGRAGQPLVLHWNGRRWKRIRVSRFKAELHGITAVGPRSVWAVGWRYNRTLDEITLAARWNGRSWMVARTPNRGYPLINHMDDVAAVSPRNVWAVGVISDLNEDYIVPAIFRWNGRRWARRSAGVPGGVLWSIDLLRADDGWVAGWGPGARPLIERLTRC